MSALAWALIMSLAATPECTVEGMVPVFWPKVVHKESGYDPLAIRDDTENRSYYPASTGSAKAIAHQLLAKGHFVGVGLSQLTANSESAFQKKFGILVDQAFDPCRSMRVGARFFVSGALQTYNSGRPNGAPSYATAVQARIAIPQANYSQVTQTSDPPAASVVWPPQDGEPLLK